MVRESIDPSDKDIAQQINPILFQLPEGVIQNIYEGFECRALETKLQTVNFNIHVQVSP